MENLRLILDTNKNKYQYLMIKQQDKGRTIEFDIYSNGKPLDVSNFRIQLQVLKPDLNFVIQTNNYTIQGNKVFVNLNEAITQMNGKAKAELRIMQGDTQITSFTFPIEIQESVLKATEGSETILTVLDDLADGIKDAQVIVDKINEGGVKLFQVESSQWKLNSATGFYECELTHNLGTTKYISECRELVDGKWVNATLIMTPNGDTKVKLESDNNRANQIFFITMAYTGAIGDPALIDVDSMVDGSDKVVMTAQERQDIADLKNSNISIEQYKNVGDGTINEQELFSKIENDFEYQVIDLCGKTFLVNELPCKNKYVNGFFKTTSGLIRESTYNNVFKEDLSRIFIGRDAGAYIPDYRGATNYNLLGIGRNALKNAVNASSMIALGHGALENCNNSKYNVAIGLESLYNTTGEANDTFKGTRNSALGDNTGRFNYSGYGNCYIGRNSGQCNNGDRNIYIGIGSGSGNAPLDLDNKIKNQEPTSNSDQILIGTEAGYCGAGTNTLAIGNRALRNAKMSGDRNLAIGNSALENLQNDRDNNNKNIINISKTGQYEWDKTIMTVTCVNHGFDSDDCVLIQYTSGEANKLTGVDKILYSITVIDDNTFSYIVPVGVGSGSINILERRTGSNNKLANFNGAIGYACLNNLIDGESNIGFGFNTFYSLKEGSNNVAIGSMSGMSHESGINNTVVGHSAYRFGNQGNNNTIIGSLGGSDITGNDNTSLGYASLRRMQNDSLATEVQNCTGVGANSRVSADNQVQLGSYGTTTYAYGSVQNRSDIRDKADVRDTVLGLDFISKLRPVDFKWDYRESYYDEDDEGNSIKHTKDGSRKRLRYHHGLIAQEVRDVINNTGVDFGGFQDHSINGGCDVLSIGYDELIAPLIKSIQELKTEIDELKSINA